MVLKVQIIMALHGYSDKKNPWQSMGSDYININFRNWSASSFMSLYGFIEPYGHIMLHQNA
jgi:hypothetical protein